MKNFIVLLLVFTSVFSNLSADLPGQAPSKPINKLTNPFQHAPETPEKPIPRHFPHPLTTRGVGGPPYTLPGIVGLRNNLWVGSDNLYNLSTDISVYVEVVMPENKKVDLNTDAIKARVEELFSKNGITPHALQGPGSPPLPLFHVLVLLDNIEQISIASCACRLFESIGLRRVFQEEGITFQGITWEKQELIVVSKNDFNVQLVKTIDALTESFVERVHYFQNLKVQKESSQ